MKKRKAFLIITFLFLTFCVGCSLYSSYILRNSHSSTLEYRSELFDAAIEKLADETQEIDRTSVIRVIEGSKEVDYADEEINNMHIKQAWTTVFLLGFHLSAICLNITKRDHNK